MLQRIAQSCLEFHVSELYIARRNHLCRSRQELCKFTCSCQYLSNIYLKASQSCQQSSIQPIRSWYQELVSWNGSINGMSTGSPVHSLVTRPLSARPARPVLHSASSALKPTGSLFAGYRKPGNIYLFGCEFIVVWFSFVYVLLKSVSYGSWTDVGEKSPKYSSKWALKVGNFH